MASAFSEQSALPRIEELKILKSIIQNLEEGVIAADLKGRRSSSRIVPHSRFWELAPRTWIFGLGRKCTNVFKVMA